MEENVTATPPAQGEATGPSGWFEFRNKARFVWKTLTLLVTFLALIPILLFQHELGAEVYLWFLVLVHVIGLVVFSWGVAKEDVAPTKWGFMGRLIGLVSVGILLYFVSKGLNTDMGSLVFWGSLFGLWAIHSAGLLLFHLRGREGSNCPFI